MVYTHTHTQKKSTFLLIDIENEGETQYRERNIVDKTVKNVKYCKSTYNTAFIDVATYHQHVLEHTHQKDIDDIQNNLKSKVNYVGDMMENPNYREVVRLFNQYFNTGSFPKEKIFIYVLKV